MNRVRFLEFLKKEATKEIVENERRKKRQLTEDQILILNQRRKELRVKKKREKEIMDRKNLYKIQNKEYVKAKKNFNKVKFIIND